MNFQRPQYQLVKERLLESRRFIQVLFGPRQVGKTTLTHQLVKELGIPYHIVTADAVPAGDISWLAAQWEIARTSMDQSKAGSFLLVIDEIQKIDNWSETVKSLWDADTASQRELKVLILGSSRLLLQKGLTESLAGRFETIYMGHWSFPETQVAFGWTAEQHVWFGGYPGSAPLIENEERWKAYVKNSLIETSISKDILMLTRVDKPALMKQLFELGCAYSGQILSYTKIMGQLADAGNTTTLSHYLGLLDTAGLLGGIEKYSKNEIRKRSSSPKFQVHNTALISAQRAEHFTEIKAKTDEWGRMVESAIGAHLLNHSITSNFSLHYWRERNDEVDFIIEKKGSVIALEVKSGTTQSNKGLSAFQKQFNPKKTLIVGNSGIPWQKFLKIDPVSLF